MRRLVAAARVARLATVGADGRPHLVPICFVLIGDVLYSATDHKPKRATGLRRFANVAATGHVCVLVDHYADDWSTLWWVRLDGRGRAVADPQEAGRAVAALAGKYPQYAQRPPTDRPVLAMEVTGWRGWCARGAGPEAMSG
jgi:PPOX class probable F420-dependent enzyme